MTARGAGLVDRPEVIAYEPTFLEALVPALPSLSRYKIRVAVNAGASGTESLHKAVCKLISDAGLDLKVAWISGDEVLPAVESALSSKSSPFENVHTGVTLADWTFKPIYAQAYLGGLGIAAAFQAGADIVLCGRVSDASPIIGAAAWWHGWDRSRLDCLANALVAGHLIECSSYVTGGNYSGFRTLEASMWEELGYPIADISASGVVVLTKSKGSGGMVDVGTCTAQLLYEIQGPYYYNSDVTAVLDGISFEQLGTDRVALHGVRAMPPPPTTKVGITARGGYQAEVHWFLVGLDIQAKASMLETQIRRILSPHSSRFTLLAFTLNGSCPDNPTNQCSATVDLRILAQAPNAADLAGNKFARLCLDVFMCAYPGATPHLDMRMAFPKPIYEYFVTLLPQTAIQHRVHLPFIAPNHVLTIPPPPITHVFPARQPSTDTTTLPLPQPPRDTLSKAADHAAGAWAELPARPGASILRESFGPWGRTVRAPLGWVVHGRSGDKGSDANLGLWVRHAAEWDWLRSLLSVQRIKALLADEYVPGRAVERFEIPGLRAVHFLLRDHLDRGVSCSSSYDALGKNVAEFVRARWVDVPVRFLERGRL